MPFILDPYRFAVGGGGGGFGEAISVDFGTSSLTTSDSIGVDPYAEWNNVTGTTATNLNNDSGSPTTCDLTVTGRGGTSSETRATDDASNEYDMMFTGFRGNAGNVITFAFVQIPSWTSWTARLYVDERTGSATGEGAAIDDGTTTFYLDCDETGQWTGGGFVQITSENAGSPDTLGNYVEFSGLSGTSKTFTITTDTNPTLVCSGIQLIEEL